MKKVTLLLSFILAVYFSGFTQNSELYTFLKSIPGIEIQKRDTSAYKEFYIVMFPQPVNHKDINSPKFKQRIFIGHAGFDRPTVMVTEGYGADYVSPATVDEPTSLLNANQLYVEHRYFGPSTPSPLDWKYLNAEQDANDYHNIRKTFGQIYKGKWVATGVSKGGQTATEYKVYFPDDVDVTIPYVAPINYARLDKRIDKHFKKVGTSEKRKQLKEIQLYLLKNKKDVLKEWIAICEKAEFKFTIMNHETAYEYSVLELPFSFWQYAANSFKLPDVKNTNPKYMAQFLFQVVSPFWYTDAVKSLEPAMYQFYTQLGYYEYNEKPFKQYLSKTDYPNSAFVPKNVEIKWDDSYQRKLKAFIASNPQRMLFIYGELDPWGATAADIKPGSGSLLMMQKNGTHGAHINSLHADQKAEVKRTLSLWLDMTIE